MAKLRGLSILLFSLVPSLAAAQTITFSVISAGNNVGYLTVKNQGDLTTVDFNVRDNGRGPTISETIRTGPAGLPVDWSIKGSTTFGSKVDEHFRQIGSHAEWMDPTGSHTAAISQPALYVNQGGSPWLDQILVRALLRAPGMTMGVLPEGRLHLEKGAGPHSGR